MIIWLIGLSGSGKTTLAEKVVEIVRAEKRQVVLLDGDRVRELFGGDLGYGIEDRRKSAQRMCNFCEFLDNQGIDVICAFLSIFPESRNWCRDNLSSYYEVFIDTPIQYLKKRDSKGLYARYARGEVNNVVGIDLEFVVPTSPDLTIVNDGGISGLLSHAPKIADQILNVRL